MTSPLPWAKFFWSDWRSDPGLRASSAHSRGIWMDCLCIAAEADPTGYVLVNGRTPTTTDLARLTGEPEAAVQSALEELERNGVFSRDRNGRIYNRRMVRDVRRIVNNRKNGKLGGNPKLLNNKDDLKSVNPPDNPSDKAKKPEATSHKEEEKPSLPGGHSAREIAEHMLAIWREECGDLLGQPMKLSPGRITQCSARLGDLGGDIEAWRDICRRIRRSHFLTERWKATIDWVLKPANLLKIQEGNYDDRAIPLFGRPGRQNSHDDETAAFEAVSRGG